jgi:hypothetical protein
MHISAVFISSIIFAKLLAGGARLLADCGGMAEAEGDVRNGKTSGRPAARVSCGLLSAAFCGVFKPQ